MDRKRQGIFTGIFGLILNAMLGAMKLVIGIIFKSASIVADAVNNISDSASSLVTVSSFVLANRSADKEHPYGHGRYEYIAGLVIGIIILFVGFQFLLTGIDRIRNPQTLSFGVLAIIILSISIATKLFMGFYYRFNAKRINSNALKASSLDSFFDVLITTVVLISFILNKFLTFNIDGICTVIVSLAVMWGGIRVISEASGKLLGNGADPELIGSLYGMVLSHPSISGAHDLSIHDYGPDKKVGTIHAEFDNDLTITLAHEIIDELEKEAFSRYGVELVIHVDPIICKQH